MTARYRLEFEIVEGNCPPYPKGAKFEHPEDLGRLCPWLVDSMSGMLKVLALGGTLPWQYPGTPYEKEMDPLGVTTEFVRCPDPTDRGVVLKITRRAVPECLRPSGPSLNGGRCPGRPGTSGERSG